MHRSPMHSPLRSLIVSLADGRDNFGDLVKSAVKEEITAERYLVRREEGKDICRNNICDVDPDMLNKISLVNNHKHILQSDHYVKWILFKYINFGK